MKQKRLPWMLFAFFFMLPAVVFASQGPQISFEKKVYTDTTGGKLSFYETYRVEKGDSLWKLLVGKNQITSRQFAEKLKDFKRANPNIKDPSRLTPGQEIVIPVDTSDDSGGKTVSHLVKKGDSLSRLYVAAGSPGGSLKEFLKVVREINPSVGNVNKIYAGSTLRLPTHEYFAQTPPSPFETERPIVAAAPVERTPEPDARDDAKPQAELLPKDIAAPDSSFIETGKDDWDTAPITAPVSTPYRGLLSDIFNALGEEWIEKGNLFLPLPSGEDAVIMLSDFPMVKFSGNKSALIDFQGGLPIRVREGIKVNMEHIQVVSLQGARDAAERIDRILQVSGYHSIKEGITHPLVIGDAVSVTIPARWIIQKTSDDLLSDDVALLKETTEKPTAVLVSILRYAQRVGVRVLPFAVDPAATEGFLVGFKEEESARGIPVAFIAPSGGGLPAVDFALSFLGITSVEGEKLQVGGPKDAIQFELETERIFKAAGKTFIVDTGRIAEPLQASLKKSGHEIFTIKQGESGISIFERLVKAVGGNVEARGEHVVADGGEVEYEVRIDGSRVVLPQEVAEADRKIFVIKDKTHSATRMLLKELGVEIVEWES